MISFVFDYAQKSYNTKPDYPFKEDFETAVLRHSDTRKWYAIVMNVKKSVFSLGEGRVWVMNLKLDALSIGSFIQKNGIYPAYHMAKGSWVSVLLDGSVDKETIALLIDISYNLTQNKRRKTK